MSPALTGAISAVSLFIVLGIGAWLFRVVPEAKRRSVAMAMMTVGGLALASTVLRSFGIVRASNATDVLFIVLFIGGFVVCIVGLILYQKVKADARDAQDD